VCRIVSQSEVLPMMIPIRGSAMTSFLPFGVG
jgi:hypothetical protein